MPGLVLHAFIPTLVMLGMRRYFDPRIVLILWPLTILPDFDYFVGVHRATGHNLFLAAGIVAVTYSLARRFDTPRAGTWTGTAAVYLGSHLLMDAFTGGIVPFYPLVNYTVCWFFYIEAVTATNDVTVYWEPCSREGIPVVSEVYPVLDTDQAAMLVFILTAWSAFVAADVHARWRGRPAAGSSDPPRPEEHRSDPNGSDPPRSEPHRSDPNGSDPPRSEEYRSGPPRPEPHPSEEHRSGPHRSDAHRDDDDERGQ